MRLESARQQMLGEFQRAAHRLVDAQNICDHPIKKEERRRGESCSTAKKNGSIALP